MLGFMPDRSTWRCNALAADQDGVTTALLKACTCECLTLDQRQEALKTAYRCWLGTVMPEETLLLCRAYVSIASSAFATRRLCSM